MRLHPHLHKNPVIVYLSDNFKKPYPFSPDVLIGIDAVVEKKIDMLHCHESQFYEWLPYNSGSLDAVPDNEVNRREWLAERLRNRFSSIADMYRNKLIEQYGEQYGNSIKYAEAFESCEYGSALTSNNIPILFPFFNDS